MSHWQIRVEDPSGETRFLGIEGSMKIGRSQSCEIPLRDACVGPECAMLWAAPKSRAARGEARQGSPFWIRMLDSTGTLRLGDLAVREAQLPLGLPVHIGETRLTLEKTNTELSLPEQPAQMRHWLTCAESGRKLLWTAKKAAATPLSLYLAGETGTGKEVVAHLLHAWSDRASGPFVPLHCAALPLSLAESELFGHVKGAFTGATHPRSGALMQAHNGTLFLDEVGDLPMDIQVKLLRFLENGEIRPVGADRSSRADVRLICATHHPLQKLVEEGKFRRDLYYRLASVMLEIPSLRTRPEDVELLAKKFAAELGKSLSPRALFRLQAHTWPGNVRELRHAIERASGMTGPFSPILHEESFDFLLGPESLGAPAAQEEFAPAILSLQEMEKLMLLRALKLARGNRSQAAKILGIARSTLFEMLKRHRIIGPRGGEEDYAA